MHQTRRPQSHLADRPPPGEPACAKAQAARAEAHQLIARCGGARQAFAALQDAADSEAQRQRGLPLEPTT